MFKDDIIKYFDNIEPSNELIERTVIMTNNRTNKRVMLPRKAVAIIVAAVIMLIGVTGYAASVKIKNNDKNIAKEYQTRIVFDFTKSDNTPDSYSNSANDIVYTLNDLGYDKVLLPTELLDNATIESITPFIMDNSNIIMFDSEKYDDLELNIINNIAREDMNDFWGTGDENTIGEINNINGIDVCLTVQGSEEIGYMAFINYVINDTVYCIKYFGGDEQIKTYDSGIEFISSLEQ